MQIEMLDSKLKVRVRREAREVGESLRLTALDRNEKVQVAAQIISQQLLGGKILGKVLVTKNKDLLPEKFFLFLLLKTTFNHGSTQK